MSTGERLESIVGHIVDELTTKNRVRDATLQRSRELIRFCANSIRATHRREYDLARELLAQAKEAAARMREDAAAYGDVYHAGYTQDALKELVEASVTLAVVTGQSLPEPDELEVEYAAYLNGLGEAAGEFRRFALDSIRRGEIDRAEGLLATMDEIYSQLVTVDFPDSLTGGLRRTTDMVRGVTERTRGDLTTAARQEKLQATLRRFERRLTQSQESADGIEC
ncbi:MAG: haloacid dehalogenase [Anaerolineae bacterium]|nr:haloacid dehalogenase [Anaerolineae bacterium]